MSSQCISILVCVMTIQVFRGCGCGQKGLKACIAPTYTHPCLRFCLLFTMLRIETKHSLTPSHPILSLTKPYLNWLACNCMDLGICEISVQDPYPRPITLDIHQQGPSIGVVCFENQPSRSSGGGDTYSLIKSYVWL